MKERIKMTPEQLERAIRLQRQGLTHERIAAELGVHRLTLGSALRKFNERVYERVLKRAAAEKGRQLSQLEQIIADALRQFRRSCQDERTFRTTTAGQFPGDTTTTKGQSGNPALLAQAMAALAERRKILGLDRAEADDDDPLIVAEMMAQSYAPEDDDP